jgi:hypothetical protein
MEKEMAYYMGIHTLPGFTKEMLTQATPALEQLTPANGSDAQFMRALSSFSEGRVICEFEAPSKESVAAAYAQLGFLYDVIVEVDAICVGGDTGVTTTDV